MEDNIKHVDLKNHIMKEIISLKKESSNEALKALQQQLRLRGNGSTNIVEPGNEEIFSKNLEDSFTELSLHDENVCFYLGPPYHLAVPETAFLDRKAKDLNGGVSDYYKKTSLVNRSTGEINLSCISGNFMTEYYPCEIQDIFGYYNESCGTVYERISVPDDIIIHGESSVKLEASIAMPGDSSVYKLVPRGENRYVGVVGFVYITLTTNGLGGPITKKTSKFFLGKFKNSSYETPGTFIPNFKVSLENEITEQRRSISISVVVNIATYTTKSFRDPSDIIDLQGEYALVDFRKQGHTRPYIIPDEYTDVPSRRGPGGIKLKWLKLCVENATQSTATFDLLADISSMKELL